MGENIKKSFKRFNFKCIKFTFPHIKYSLLCIAKDKFKLYSNTSYHCFLKFLCVNSFKDIL